MSPLEAAGRKNRPAYLTYIIGQVHLYELPAPAMNDQERLDKEAMCAFSRAASEAWNEGLCSQWDLS